MNLSSKIAGGLLALFIGGVWGLPALGDDIFVRNVPFKRAVYAENVLYVPMADFMRALRMHWAVDPNTKRLLFRPDLTEGGDTLPEEPIFEGEYEGTVFPVNGLTYEGEIWIPARFVAERLGFGVNSNASTGIIDIVKSRSISQADRDCARELQEEHEAKVKRAEEILAARRAEKKARLQREAEEAEEAARKKAAEKAAAKRSPVKKSAKSVSEGSFPAEFDEYEDTGEAALKPRRAQAVSEDGGSYPRSKSGSGAKTKKKVQASAAGKTELTPAAKETAAEKADTDTEAAQGDKEAKDIPAAAFVTYMAPLAAADYSTGDFKLSAEICNRGETEARNVSAVLSVFDFNGKTIIKKSVHVGTLAPGQSVVVKESGRHPQRGSMPRGNYELKVELNWD